MKKLLSLALLVGFLGVVTGCTAENKSTVKPTTAPKPVDSGKMDTDKGKMDTDKGKTETPK